MRLKNKKLIIPFGFLILFSLIYWNCSSIYKGYLMTLKKSGVVAHFNSKGQIDGRNYVIVDGKIETEADFFNGKKEGWTLRYYKNGRLKRKTWFRHNKAEGPQYGYYENGRLNYTDYYKDNKRQGNVYWYDDNGKLSSYAAYDIKGESFFYLKYDLSGKIIDTKGHVLSLNIYSLNSKDSVVLLDFNLEADKGYSDLKHLYINVASPPELHLNVNAQINNFKFKDLAIQNNCIRIPDIFRERGIYMSITGMLGQAKRRIWGQPKR